MTAHAGPGHRPTTLERAAPRRASPAAASALLALLALAAPAAAAGPAEPRAEVLVLHSYSPDYAWTRSEQAGIEEIFAPLADAYELRLEYLDAARHRELLQGEPLLALLRAKLARERVRLVITTDNAALDFARAHRSELFPGAPIVFSGVNDYDDAQLRGERDITGVAEDNDFLGTLEVAVRLQPGLRRIVLPGIAGEPSYNRAMVKKALPSFRHDVAVEFPEYPDVETALEALRALPRDSAILAINHMRTRDGQRVTAERAVELLSAAASVPVFATWDFSVGKGAVGGSITRGVDQGRWAAEIAVRILRGERPEAIPVHRGVGTSWDFDHRQLARFGIPAERLPPGAVLRYAPDSTFHVTRQAVWVAAIAFALVLLAAGSLVVTVRRRRRAEERLREANERFQAMLRAATDYSVVGTDPDGRILFFSEGSELMLGYAAEEAVGRFASELLHDPAEVAARAAELGVAPGIEVFVREARLGRTETREWTYLRKDGTRVPVSLTVSAMRGEDGAHLGFIGIARDVAAQKRMEQQLAHSQKMESVGLLAGGVAHDFNNLLTPILAHAALLLDDLDPRDPRAEALREVQAAAERAGALTRQLLAFSRKQMLELKTLALGEVLRRSERLLRRTLGEAIHIEVAIAPDLAAVRADAGQLEQVLLNLAINARDAMPRGGLLRIAARNTVVEEDDAALHPEVRPGRWVLLEVSDTGAGMSAEVLRHLFEPFFTTKEHGKGTGLGLSTVYGIVRQHGGAIVPTSEPGQGSTFRVYLPAMEGPAAGPAAEAPAATPRPRPGGNETVLVVEDSDAVRRAACEMLRKLGYRVLSAADGGQAMEVARRQGTIDLLLTDVVLPGLNGKEIAARLLRERPGLRVLYMSGYATDVIVHHGAVDEGVAFVQKPLVFETLARRVREVLEAPARARTG